MMSKTVSFSVEDETDEDFFDKLVDDDFGGGGDGQEDVDDIKVFGIEDSGGFDVNETVDGVSSEAGASDVKMEDSTNAATDSPASCSASGVIEHDNADAESCNVVDTAEVMTGESGKAGMKEIQWNSLFTDSSAGNEGFGSYADLFADGGADCGDVSSEVKESVVNGSDPYVAANLTNVVNNVTYGQTQDNGNVVEQNAYGPDENSIEYWESQYPGWKYDSSTGQWYQVVSYEASANDQQVNHAGHSEAQSAISEATADTLYCQQATHSAANSVVGTATTSSISSWNQGLQDSSSYPEHMVFDPQYPGWYYDTLAQEWRTLESYTNAAFPSETTHAEVQNNHNGIHSSDFPSNNDSKGSYLGYGQALNNVSETTITNGQNGCWNGVSSSYDQQNQKGLESNGMLVDHVDKNSSSNFGQYSRNGRNNSQESRIQGIIGSWAPSVSGYAKQDLQTSNPAAAAFNRNITENISNHEHGGLINYLGNHADQYSSFPEESASAYNKPITAHGGQTLQSFVHGKNLNKQFNLTNTEPQQQISSGYYNSQKTSYAVQQSHQTGSQQSYNPSIGRSSAGRPPHALVSFGFGGKVIVMKDNTSFVNSSCGYQDSVGCSISVLNLLEVVTERGNANAASTACDYFQTLCQQSFPGPLVGGSVGNKELNKWIDERISNCKSSDLDYREVETLRLLLSLLRIACQHYGKLRSPFGTDTSIKASDSPESSVAKLFASINGNGSQYGYACHCLQQLPSEGQLRATASEVQNLLVAGSKREALECALQGQLWGPALVLASQLGDQYHVDAVKQMALRQLVPGSPLRTLCLLIAGQSQAVFASVNENTYSDAMNTAQQSTQVGANRMLDDWQENLAVITANRTKDDELVIINLGDCLWRDRNEIIAAHICYLVADANFEPYSDSARMCIIGANHLKYPRTYASPAAIQWALEVDMCKRSNSILHKPAPGEPMYLKRTEVYEYSKVIGNSQFVLLPFQPYKLVYAYMLAELGKVSDSLKYCQAILKSLKTGRAPEVEFWKQLVTSLEERLRTHQQGGFSTNLAPAKLVGKLLNFFDSTTNRVIGGLPPPVPLAPHGSGQSHEHYQRPSVPRVAASQSTMAMSSLVPSPSTEQVNELSGQNNIMTVHNRSASEPNFGQTDQVDPSKDVPSQNTQNKASTSGGSRFGRFGFGSQLLQKTVGLVLKSRSDKQAKLGESNKFYYDEKLKSWVEEGAETPAEEVAVQPPPTTAALQNGTSDNSNKYRGENQHAALNDQRSPQPTAELGSGIPPIPPTSNHFPARARTGVRSRYVDTYNQGSGSPAQTFQSPPLPSVKRASSPANAKFFVPTPSSTEEPAATNLADSFHEAVSNQNPSTYASNEVIHSSALPSSSTTLHRHPSMVNISRNEIGHGTLPHSRRTASWGGSVSDSFSPTKASEVKPVGDMLDFSSFMASDASPANMLPGNGGSSGDDLHEVEL